MAIAQYLTDDEKRAVKKLYYYNEKLGYWNCRCPMAIALNTLRDTPPSHDVTNAIVARRPELAPYYTAVHDAAIEFINWYDPENADPENYLDDILEAIGYYEED